MMNHYFSVSISCLLLSTGLGQSASAQNTRLDPAFQLPQIMQTGTAGPVVGTVYDIVRQPDGKYVIGGSFSSINGVRARNLARLQSDGTLDVAFTTNSRANGPVYSVALQPDGRILAGGQFDSLAGSARAAVGRLLPTGSLDAAFNANLTSGTDIRQVAALPSGDALILSPTGPSNWTPTGMYRLNGQTGQRDLTFQQAVTALCFAVQPDGRIITGGGGGSYMLMHLLARLLPNGSLDPSFNHYTSYYNAGTKQVAQNAAGQIYMNSLYTGLTGPTPPSYATGPLTTFTLQPNGRVLVARFASRAGGPLTGRVIGAPPADVTYVAANGPVANAAGIGQVERILVQPDGAIMMAGSFTLAGTTPVHGLIRMLDANVLAAKDSRVEKGTSAWPVPADNVLNVSFEPTARPQRVELLDALGRSVLSQDVATGTTELALPVATLPAGVYGLRVSYAQAAPVVRRIELKR